MKIWLISDTHYNHTEKMIEYCGRPDNYEELLNKNLSAIPKEDVLIHLGDINIGKVGEMHERYIKPLQCKKWLIRGNHDRKSYSWYVDNGWDFVADEIKLRYAGKRVVFTHVPIAHREDFDLNIHGHFHNTTHRSQEEAIKELYTEDHHALISSERLDYSPILLNRFLQI